MNAPLILDFDRSVGDIPNAVHLDLSYMQDAIRFACTFKTFDLLRQHLNQYAPDQYGTVLLGSGDYHHVSLLLIERLQRQLGEGVPFEVVIFDNHPDNMRFPFGVHCGSWVSYVARLPFVTHVHVVGITSSDISLAHAWENRWLPLWMKKLTYWSMNVNVKWAKIARLGHAFKSFASPDELISAFLASQLKNKAPVYLSIDKDVLSTQTIKTNWDQGLLNEYHLIDSIATLGKRIVGSDINGEVSTWHYRQKWKRFLSALDGQERIPSQTLESWQTQQRALNTRLLSVFDSIAAHSSTH